MGRNLVSFMPLSRWYDRQQYLGYSYSKMSEVSKFKPAFLHIGGLLDFEVIYVSLLGLKKRASRHR